MTHRGILLLLAMCAWAPASGRAATIIITGNYAPQFGYNTIDANDAYAADFVWVRNSGCTVQYPCLNPGAPTDLQVVSGGVVGYSLTAWETSRVHMSGGSIGLHLIGYGSSEITMTGGSVTGGILAYDSSTVTITGGSTGAQLAAHIGSTIVVVGSDFAIDGIPVPYGLLPANVGVLTGLLASGDSLDTFLGDAISPREGRIMLVPEPRTASLVALGLLLVSRFRRRPTR